jgi:hypothetical protein
MMRFLTLDAHLVCAHPVGVVAMAASQSWVTIDGRPILVAPDPLGRSISGCTNASPVTGILPCRATVSVTQGYSSFVRIEGHQVCLETLRGITSGTPIGTVEYSVSAPGQTFVQGAA